VQTDKKRRAPVENRCHPEKNSKTHPEGATSKCVSKGVRFFQPMKTKKPPERTGGYAMNLTIELLDDVMALFRQDVAESGMSEAELDAFFEEVREEVWQEQQARKA